MIVFAQYVYREKGNFFFLIMLIKSYQCRSLSTDFNGSRAKPVLSSVSVLILFPPQEVGVFLSILLKNIFNVQQIAHVSIQMCI